MTADAEALRVGLGGVRGLVPRGGRWPRCRPIPVRWRRSSPPVRTPSAPARSAAAIAAKHRQVGLASPAADPAVTAILHAARRSATPRRPPPEQPAALIRMAVRCPRDLAGLRDRALLLLAAGGLGCAALVGLDVEHIRFTATAAEFRPRNAGAGRAEPIIVHRGASLAVCPVQALRDWPDSSDTKFGPVFRKIDRWGTVEHRRLGTDAIRRILARRTPRRGRRPRKAAA